MTVRNWGNIRSGPTFEALMHSLVFSEDAEAKLFGRPGKDGGQDARSGDGKTVFQAKYNQGAEFHEAIKSAKKELNKIIEYRSPGHARFQQWQAVDRWVLVTNAPINPTDLQVWMTDIVPAFAGIGINADFWCQSRIDARLDRNADISEAFFGGENRVLLSPGEAREWLIEQEPFLQSDQLTEFVGREQQIDEVEDFTRSANRFLVIHGAGGVGKTRFMLEAATEVARRLPTQIFWANVSSMSLSSNWFRAIIADRPTLLLIDEPDQEFPLMALLEQLSTRAKTWKAIITVRSPKDHILRFFENPRNKKRSQLLPLDGLDAGEAESFVDNLLARSTLANKDPDNREQVQKALLANFSRFPIWMTMAMELLEHGKSPAELPQDAGALASIYLSEIVREGLEQPVRAVDPVDLAIKWLSLLSPLNRADPDARGVLVRSSELDDEAAALGLLNELIERRVLVARGAHKNLIEVKPDVLKDHVLETWLTIDTGHGSSPIQPTNAARELAEETAEALVDKTFTASHRSVVLSLAQLSLRLAISGRPVELLASFFAKVKERTDDTDSDTRIRILEELSKVAFFCPQETVEICRRFRVSNAKPSNIRMLSYEKVVTQDDVILALAWPLLKAAMGVDDDEGKESVLRELVYVLGEELGLKKKAGRLLNDGKRADDVLARILSGGPYFRSDFESAMLQMTLEFLDRLKHNQLKPELSDVVLQFCDTALKVERRWTTYDPPEITTTTFLVLPGHPAWSGRNKIVESLRRFLESEHVSLEIKKQGWAVLARSHTNLHRALLRSPNEHVSPSVLKEELEWMLARLSSSTLELSELSAARGVWSWQLEHGDGELKELAEKLEAVYLKDDLAREFSPLLTFDCGHEEREERIKIKVEEVLKDGTKKAIWDFFRRFFKYAAQSTQDQVGTRVSLALLIGKNATDSDEVRQFILNATESPDFLDEVTVQKLARGWFDSVRSIGSEDSGEIVRQLLGKASSESLKMSLVSELLRARDLTNSESELLRGQAELFERCNRVPDFLSLIARTCCRNFGEFKSLAEAVISRAPQQQSLLIVAALAEGVLDGVWGRSSSDIPTGLSEWVLQQILTVDNFDRFWFQCDTKLAMLVERAGRPSLEWFSKLLETQCAQNTGQDLVQRFLFNSIELSKLVEPITEANAADCKDSLTKILDLCHQHFGLYGSLEVTKNLDAEGKLLPGILVEKGSLEAKKEERFLFSAYAGIYPINSEAWRTIARPALDALQKESDEKRWEWYSELCERGSVTWSAVVGQVPEFFYKQVSSTEQFLLNETDPVFRPFWDWRLRVVSAELIDAEERAKEALER